MAASRRGKGSWLEIAIRTAGFRDAVRALSWAHDWGVVRIVLGHDPSAEEVADWWRKSVRTAYREQASFRKAFPKLDTPAPVIDVPQVQAGFRKALAALDELSEAKRYKTKMLDSAILEIGLLSPS
jgi:hypothetical protein